MRNKRDGKDFSEPGKKKDIDERKDAIEFLQQITEYEELKKFGGSNEQKEAFDFLGQLLQHEEVDRKPETSQIFEKKEDTEKIDPKLTGLNKKEKLKIGLNSLKKIFLGASEKDRLDGMNDLKNIIKPTTKINNDVNADKNPDKYAAKQLTKIINLYAHQNIEEKKDVITVLAYLLDVRLVNIEERFAARYLTEIKSLNTDINKILFREVKIAFTKKCIENNGFMQKNAEIDLSSIENDSNRIWRLFFQLCKKQNVDGLPGIVNQIAIIKKLHKSELKKDAEYKIVKFLKTALHNTLEYSQELDSREDIFANLVNMIDYAQDSSYKSLIPMSNLERNLPANIDIKRLPFRDYEKGKKILAMKNDPLFVRPSDFTLINSINEEDEIPSGRHAASAKGLKQKAYWGASFDPKVYYEEGWDSY